MANLVDPLRHMSVFSPQSFGQREVHVVGCGATGSRIAMELAKLGVQCLHLWDYDQVEEHNVANQLFGVKDVGRTKVAALAERISADTGLDCVSHCERVTAETSLQGVVYLLTDTMASRREIWDGAIRLKPWVDVMIETRMDKYEARVYTVSPTSPAEFEFWERTLYSDGESTASLCGSRVSVGPTAALIQAHAVWAMIRWFDWYKNGGTQPPDVELLMSINPPVVIGHTPRFALR